MNTTSPEINEAINECEKLAKQMALRYPEIKITFGYIGNADNRCDDRSWKFFTSVANTMAWPGTCHSFGYHSTEELPLLVTQAKEKLEPFLREIQQLDPAKTVNYYKIGPTFDYFSDSPAATHFLREIIDHRSPDEFHWGDIEDAEEIVKKEPSTVPEGWKIATPETRRIHSGVFFEKETNSESTMWIVKEDDKFVGIHKSKGMEARLEGEWKAADAAKRLEYFHAGVEASNLAKAEEGSDTLKKRRKLTN